jgi:hypothetical protein
MSMLLGIASNLAYTLLQMGGTRVRNMALGEPEQRALQDIFQKAFEEMLYLVGIEHLMADTKCIQDIFEEFIREPEVAEALLSVVLEASPLDLETLTQQFEKKRQELYPRSNFVIELEEPLHAFTSRIDVLLNEEASQSDSTLFNLVTTRRLTAIQRSVMPPKSWTQMGPKIVNNLGGLPADAANAPRTQRA